MWYSNEDITSGDRVCKETCPFRVSGDRVGVLLGGDIDSAGLEPVEVFPLPLCPFISGVRMTECPLEPEELRGDVLIRSCLLWVGVAPDPCRLIAGSCAAIGPLRGEAMLELCPLPCPIEYGSDRKGTLLSGTPYPYL